MKIRKKGKRRLAYAIAVALALSSWGGHSFDISTAYASDVTGKNVTISDSTSAATIAVIREASGGSEIAAGYTVDGDATSNTLQIITNKGTWKENIYGGLLTMVKPLATS